MTCFHPYDGYTEVYSYDRQKTGVECLLFSASLDASPYGYDTHFRIGNITAQYPPYNHSRGVSWRRILLHTSTNPPNITTSLLGWESWRIKVHQIHIIDASSRDPIAILIPAVQGLRFKSTTLYRAKACGLYKAPVLCTRAMHAFNT